MLYLRNYMIALLLLVAFITLSNTCTAQMTPGDIKESLSFINRERRIYGLPQVTYNHSIQKELESVPKDYWFNKTLNQTHEFYLGSQLRVRPYNLYFHNVTDPFKYLFHDTAKTTMASILRFRVKQRPCFKLDKCSEEDFEMFYTCGGRESHLVNSKPCSWFMHYYPRIILKSLKQIGCILPRIEGPSVPDNLKGVQKKVFICYGDYGTIESDNPLQN